MISIILRNSWVVYALSVAIFVCSSQLCRAQYDKVWAFGYNAGIDFGTNPPQPFKTGMTQLEGSVAISNNLGKLLFYTDGYNVWNRDHVVMPNGADLNSAGRSSTMSTSQAAVIVPFPGTAHRYFLFSLSDAGGFGWGDTAVCGKLTYCIVDMSLDGGKGDVLPESRNTLVDTGFTEHLAAVVGDRCDAWLIAVTRYDSTFKVYHLTSDGIDPVPVVSKSYHAVDYQYSTACGYMDLSPDRKRLAIAQDNIALYDFDVLAGRLSNPLILPFPDSRGAHGAGYGMAFSPDQTKLYLSRPSVGGTSQLEGLWQLDITSGDPEVILNGKVKIADERIFGLRRAPDGKIYGARGLVNIRDGVLDVVAAPNLPGAQCRFTAGGFALAPGTTSSLGLPTTAIMLGKMELLSTKTSDTFYCTKDLLLEPSRAGGYNFKWEDGSTADSRRVDRSGLYTLYYQVPVSQGCQEFIDTFDITFLDKRKVYNRYAIEKYCPDDTAFLRPTNRGAAPYRWQDGFTGMERSVNQEGVYWVHYSSDSLCQEYIDSFIVSYDLSNYSVSNRYVIEKHCPDDTAFLKTTYRGAAPYQWQDGFTGMERSVNQEGIYWVHYYSDSLCQEYIDSFIVSYDLRDYKVSFEVDTLACQHQLLTFRNHSDSHYNQFQWFMGDGNQYTESSPDHQYIRPGKYEVMLTGMTPDHCKDTATVTIEVDSLVPVVFRSLPDTICMGTAVTFSHDLQGPAIDHLQWSFGDGGRLQSPEKEIRHAYDLPGSLPVVLTAQFRACPAQAFRKMIYVESLPEIDLGREEALCLGAAPLFLYNRHPHSSSSYQHLWSTGDTLERIVARHPGVYALSVSHRATGCANREEVEVKKDCYAHLPNVFSPNGDGTNDYFFPRQYLTKSVTQFHMQILNRWGQLIFESHHVEGRGWDGAYNGQPQPGGVYVYRIKVSFQDERQEEYSGNVTLIR